MSDRNHGLFLRSPDVAEEITMKKASMNSEETKRELGSLVIEAITETVVGEDGDTVVRYEEWDVGFEGAVKRMKEMVADDDWAVTSVWGQTRECYGDRVSTLVVVGDSKAEHRVYDVEGKDMDWYSYE